MEIVIDYDGSEGPSWMAWLSGGPFATAATPWKAVAGLLRTIRDSAPSFCPRCGASVPAMLIPIEMDHDESYHYRWKCSYCGPVSVWMRLMETNP
jgi:ribosomal protein S27AE